MSVSHVPFLRYSVSNNEIWVRGRSRSLKTAPFESLGTVSYSYFIVTMALSCIISEIKRVIGRKSLFFITLEFGAPIRGSPSDYCHTAWCGKTRMAWLPDGEKVW